MARRMRPAGLARGFLAIPTRRSRLAAATRGGRQPHPFV